MLVDATASTSMLVETVNGVASLTRPNRLAHGDWPARRATSPSRRTDTVRGRCHRQRPRLRPRLRPRGAVVSEVQGRPTGTADVLPQARVDRGPTSPGFTALAIAAICKNASGSVSRSSSRHCNHCARSPSTSLAGRSPPSPRLPTRPQDSSTRDPLTSGIQALRPR